MIYDYLLKNFDKGEPIFLSEIPSKSKSYIRVEMKKLVDEGLLERFYNGVYYLPYRTVLGTKGKISFEKFIAKKFLYDKNSSIGYIGGLRLANLYGFTTQNASAYDIYSNAASTKQRTLKIGGRTVNIYKPYTEVKSENIKELEFLELMRDIYKYSEVDDATIKKKLKRYIKINKIDFRKVKDLIKYYPDIVYKNIYKVGLMNELV
jgi:hypothetical protein